MSQCNIYYMKRVFTAPIVVACSFLFLLPKHHKGISFHLPHDSRSISQQIYYILLKYFLHIQESQTSPHICTNPFSRFWHASLSCYPEIAGLLQSESIDSDFFPIDSSLPFESQIVDQHQFMTIRIEDNTNIPVLYHCLSLYRIPFVY